MERGDDAVVEEGWDRGEERGEHSMRDEPVEERGEQAREIGGKSRRLVEEEDVDDVEMEETDEEGEGSEDSEDDSSFINDEEEEEPPEGGDAEDEEFNAEAQLTDAEIDDLVRELLDVESRAAEAQEALEQESLEKVEAEVRLELTQTLSDEKLEIAVSSEMRTFIEQWETVLDELETESSLLLEQLDGAGIDLPTLFRSIESLAPSNCYTEAWRKRTHWAGSEVTSEIKESVTSAERFLQSSRPVRRQHGKLLEEGASGFLAKKMVINTGGDTEANGVTWSSFNKFISSNKDSDESLSFGSKNWATVYLATTPHQAATLGLNFPGVNEVEEIDEIKIDSVDPFYADAILNEQDIDLSEEQRRKFRKVTEESDANAAKKLHSFLNKRRRKRCKHEETSEIVALENGGVQIMGLPVDCSASPVIQSKSFQPVVLDSDDDVVVIEKNGENLSHKRKIRSTSPISMKDGVDIINVDADPCPSPRGLLLQTEVVDDFHCTACIKLLTVSEVRRHIILDVIVCEDCNHIIEEKMQKDIDLVQCYCRWCGKCVDLVNCSFCKMSFCSTCLCRNLGDEQLLQSKLPGWRCCLCEPTLLHKFVMACSRAFDNTASSSSNGSEFDSVSDVQRKRKRRRKIRRILDDTELGEVTKQKIEMEKARQEHLKSMKYAQQPLENVISDEMNAEGANTEILGDAESGYIVNVYREENEDPVKIPPSTSHWLKPHQIAGIRFMWQNIIQSVRKVRSGDKGLGCILAHTMGLGKTFQVITFLYTAIRSVDMGLKTALIVSPVNVLHNWRQEFNKWKPSELKRLRVFMLEDVPRDKRIYLLSKWKEKGGILLIGYAAFRSLSLGKHAKDQTTASEICHALQNTPDILVCDEAHIIKNRRADITRVLKQVKTQRRIALTGSPLQNNLMEYYCMVDFVREGFLGSSHEFRNRFQNPIETGQHANSTAEDVKIMNQRSHILYEQLKGFVQRMDLNVVKKDLPPKTVYVISVKLSPLQKKLYKRFLDGFTSEKLSVDRGTKKCFFAGYQTLAQIWNHPGLLQMAKQHRETLTREDIVENIFEDGSSSDDNIDHRTDVFNGDRQPKNDLLQKRAEGFFLNEEIDWWQDLLLEKIYKEADYSGKMVLLLDILRMSSEVGDKVLIFSQSLATLDLIELFLSKLTRKGTEGKYWKQGKDWYRLDGSTAGADRQKLVENFNDPKNTRVKCTLISTRAGSLGINLYAANRVIIVDGSWNPTNDLQAIYRAWRYGQVKPVYAYRLMAHGTMEEKIYKRQVTKEGLAARVVDRQQIYRTMSKEEVLHLFEFGDDEIAELTFEQNNGSPDHYQSGNLASFLKQKSSSLTNEVGLSDKLMENLLNTHHPRWIQDYHEHEMLLQENEEERLSKEEQDMAWETFLRTLEWEEVNRVSIEEQLTRTEQKPPRNPPTQYDHRRAPNVQESRHHAPSFPESSNASQVKGRSNRPAPQRKCSNLSHLLTLRSQGTKSGASTICTECSQEISWENLNRDSRAR